MTVHLKKNDVVRLAITANRKENARVKDWIDNGCICFAYSGAIALRPGTKVQVEKLESDLQAYYYMQSLQLLDEKRTELHLSRNISSQFDHRRRWWRVPYTTKTCVRRKNSQQFVEAEFGNISMEAAYLLVGDNLAVNMEVELLLLLPEYPEHTVSGRVTRSSDTALDKDAYGNDRFGVVVRFTNMPKLVSRHLTYFMWQQIRRTHLHQLQKVFTNTGHQPGKSVDAPAPPTNMAPVSPNRPNPQK